MKKYISVDEQSLLPGEYLLSIAYNSFCGSAYEEFSSYFSQIIAKRQVIIDNYYRESMLFLDNEGTSISTHMSPEVIINKSLSYGRYLINKYFSNVYDNQLNTFITKCMDLDNIVVSLLYRKLFNIARLYNINNLRIHDNELN